MKALLPAKYEVGQLIRGMFSGGIFTIVRRELVKKNWEYTAVYLGGSNPKEWYPIITYRLMDHPGFVFDDTTIDGRFYTALPTQMI